MKGKKKRERKDEEIDKRKKEQEKKEIKNKKKVGKTDRQPDRDK